MEYTAYAREHPYGIIKRQWGFLYYDQETIKHALSVMWD
jgi:hypothetical protein